MTDPLLKQYFTDLSASNKQTTHEKTCREYRPENLRADSQAPLLYRLEKQLHSIPAEVKQSGLLMEDIKKLCTGRYRRSHPHPGDVAKALIQLGWTKQRSWAAEATRETLWFPSKI